MFYSHTFLARKGPLGTVWCAAHLQHRLKKSHYISTNVPSTVERIMFPEVPIALRMSGHLLLGVVRVYSKQVDYLYEDCNVIRITINRIFTTAASVNLPEEATHASFQSVTFPENFELDALELDEYDMDWHKDSHIRSKADITMTEQIPTETDPYIVISFDERASTIPAMDDDTGSRPEPMEEDVPPPVEVGTAAELKTPSKQLGTDDITIGTSSPQEMPSIETMRDARSGFDVRTSPILPDRAEPDEFLEEQINKDKETHTPQTEEPPLPGGGAISSPRDHEQQRTSGRLDSPQIFVHQSPELELQPTPPIARQPVKRKRKQFFDEAIILSNQHIQRELDDTSDICRARRSCPSFSLAIWKRNNRLKLKKDGLFIQPSVTGSCADLHDIYKEDSVSVKFPPVSAEERQLEPSADQPFLPQRDDEMEIEVLRNAEHASPDRDMPPFTTVVPSPNERGYSTPVSSNVGLQSERLEATEGEGILPTAGTGASSGVADSEMKTPDTLLGEHTALSDIPELVTSAGELGFLEHDDDSPAGSKQTPELGILGDQGTPELRAFSSRTRAVAQYLKRQSATPIPGDTGESSEDLSLHKILEGKTRKICARMFYETLVLKSHDLVDVHQEAPYDDITLKATPKLSKGQFSG